MKWLLLALVYSADFTEPPKAVKHLYTELADCMAAKFRLELANAPNEVRAECRPVLPPK